MQCKCGDPFDDVRNVGMCDTCLAKLFDGDTTPRTVVNGNISKDLEIMALVLIGAKIINTYGTWDNQKWNVVTAFLRVFGPMVANANVAIHKLLDQRFGNVKSQFTKLKDVIPSISPSCEG